MTPDFLTAIVIAVFLCSGLWMLRALWRYKGANLGGTLFVMTELLTLSFIFYMLSSGRFIGVRLLPVSLSRVIIDFLPSYLALFIGAGIVALIHQWGQHDGRSPAYTFGLALPLLTAGVMGLIAFLSPAPPVPMPDLQAMAATLPPGFQVAALTPPHTFDRPTAFTHDKNGVLYIAASQGIMAWDGSGQMSAFALDVTGALGLAWYEGVVYAAGNGRVLQLRDTDNDLQADQMEVLIDGLPVFVYSVHANNGLAIGPDERLYMTLGGTSDHGPETEPLAGSILVMNQDGTELAVYAGGLRNPYDLAFCPDGRLFATDNGPNVLGDGLLYIPPDEVNLIQAGKQYGYPDFYGYPPPGSGTEAPLALLPMHAAATGITCYPATPSGFPPEYAQRLFVTLWGSDAALTVQTGRQLTQIEVRERDGRLWGDPSRFMGGLGNPIDVLVDADGRLLVLDYAYGQIFQIYYGGE